VSNRERQLQEAAARAKATGDFRPYPDGWPRGTLPFGNDPNIAESIQQGQTMTEVASIMGKELLRHTMSRSEFLDRLRKTYERYPSSHKLPQDLRGIEERLPAMGQFVHWQYQGFSSTADWIVVFFASPREAPESEPRVIARGVFGLGCY
jgi:hypothetical protein